MIDCSLPLPHHELRVRIQKHILVRVHDLGSSLALRVLELKLQQQFRQHQQDFTDGEVSPRACLASVTERQAVRVRLACGEFVLELAVVGVTLAVVAHWVKDLRVLDTVRIVTVMVTRPCYPRAFGDLQAILELEWDQGNSLWVHCCLVQ